MGFKRAANEAGLTIGPEYIQEGTFDKLGGHAKASILLRLLPRPTAIFAGNDMIALGVLLAVREAGWRCPQDVSLVGFDNLDLAEMINPPLSSVYQPGYQLGATAARLLLERVADSFSRVKHLVLETELRVRLSAGPPSGPKANSSSSSRMAKSRKPTRSSIKSRH